MILFPNFLYYATQFGLTEYVDEKLHQIGPKQIHPDAMLLLYYAVRCVPESLRYPHRSKLVSFQMWSQRGEARRLKITTLWKRS
jgi:hypothetical protein